MRSLKKLGFDIGYLATLTKEDVKPLSRWESKFSRGQLKALHHLGLVTNTVQRKLLNGKSITELIFSKSSRYLDLYTRKFHNTPLRKDRRSVIAEGFLFGYPGCCVRNFAENGYAENGFVANDQEILFHWACPGCRVTPSLLPYYREAHQECQELLAAQRPSVQNLLKKTLPAAALSLIFAMAPGKAMADDPHWLSLGPEDPDGDLLTYREEVLLGAVWGGRYGKSLCGPEEALRFSAIINSLQKTPCDTSCYVTILSQNGIENCQVCGEVTDMGGVVICNPMRVKDIYIPFMGLHYMEHGSFSYDGTVNTGRVDIELLKEVLAHYNTSHFSIETTNDDDDDGLRDDFEHYFGTHINNPDSDANHLLDGAEVAEQFIEKISNLPAFEEFEPLPTDCPYLVFHRLRGSENCDICGMPINMGEVQITNPANAEEIYFPIIGLHYLAHGRFAYGGNWNSGEIDAIQLANVLGILTSAPPSGQLPEKHQLGLSNYPNPFNAGTQIEFTLPEAGHSSLKIYNINGQQVCALLNDNIEAGRHQVSWDGRDDRGVRVASGVYFCRLEYGGATKARKLLLVK